MTKIGEFILNLLFPRRCVGCGKLGTYLCSSCIKKIEFIPPFCPVCQRPAIDGATHPTCQTPYGIDGLYVLGHYKGPLKSAIKLLKYQLVSDLIDTLAVLLLRYYPSYIPKFDYLIPVPLHPKRQKLRGFNQSELLAQSLSNNLYIPTLPKNLIKIKLTKPQVDLKRDDRKKNMFGAFRLVHEEKIKDKSIGLVDDVSTTGATLFECAKVLKSHGAKTVWGIVLAHGN